MKRGQTELDPAITVEFPEISTSPIFTKIVVGVDSFGGLVWCLYVRPSLDSSTSGSTTTMEIDVSVICGW